MSLIRLKSSPIHEPVASAWTASLGTAWRALLLPGRVQWARGRRGRGLAFAGAYGGSLVLALALWGGWVAVIFLAAANVGQALGWVDALKGSPFSGFTSTSVLLATGGGLGLLAHLPMLGLLGLLAWPGQGVQPDAGSYLVNRLAYHNRLPAPGDWIWLDAPLAGGRRAARVVAVGGQEVEWTGDRWTVDGRSIDVDSSRVFAGYPPRWSFRVPSHHVLLDAVVSVAAERPADPWVLVEDRRILGRIWARSLGFWDRRLL